MSHSEDQKIAGDYIGVPTRCDSDHTLSKIIDIRAPVA
jgi:hypothetical protein